MFSLACYCLTFLLPLHPPPPPSTPPPYSSLLCMVSTDILMDDYSLKRTLKMKHTTPHGLSVTSKSEHNKGVAAALEAKYFHTPSGVMIDKAKVKSPRDCQKYKIMILFYMKHVLVPRGGGVFID